LLLHPDIKKKWNLSALLYSLLGCLLSVATSQWGIGGRLNIMVVRYSKDDGNGGGGLSKSMITRLKVCNLFSHACCCFFAYIMYFIPVMS
jgi:hypothetical protein